MKRVGKKNLLTNRDIYEFYQFKSEHCTHTDRFIRKYQQQSATKNSYLANAIIDGHIIHKKEAEPNQRWHFTESWYKKKKIDDSGFPDTIARRWCGLQCPELLLWMAEAAGITNVAEIVDEILEQENIYGKNDKWARLKMTKLIKERIDWNVLVSIIEKEKRDVE